MEPVNNDSSRPSAAERAREDAIRADQRRPRAGGTFKNMVVPPAPPKPAPKTGSPQPQAEGAEHTSPEEAAAQPDMGQQALLCRAAAKFMATARPLGGQLPTDSLPSAKPGGKAKPEAPGEDASQSEAGDVAASSSGEAGDLPPAILLNTAAAANPASPAAPTQVRRPMALPPELDQFVQYTALTHNAQGFAEFRLGLRPGVQGGAEVRIAAYGNRRVGLRISGRSRGSEVNEGDVQSLVDAIKGRGVEVVEVIIE